MEEKKLQPPWWQPAIMLFAQVASWIVLPILAGLYLGHWLDERYHTEPRYFFICVGAAFVITNVGLIVQTRDALKKMKETEKDTESDIKKN